LKKSKKKQIFSQPVLTAGQKDPNQTQNFALDVELLSLLPLWNKAMDSLKSKRLLAFMLVLFTALFLRMKPLWASSYSQPNKTNAIIRPPANANNFQYACGSTSPRLQITSISPVSAAQTQQITIGGYGFGTHQPFSGDSRVFQFSDITSGWNAGNDRWCCGGDWITVNVTKWTDHEIDMSGFGGSYGGGWSLHPGDLIRV
jgi:hypothetical protein